MTVFDMVLRTRGSNALRPSLLRWWRQALELRRQRRALAGLDDHLLRDIGLTRGASPERRRAMGAAAQARVRARHDLAPARARMTDALASIGVAACASA